MKIYKIISLIVLVVAFMSCEDVVDVELKTAAPQLVVFASMEWQKGTTGNEQNIRLTTTTGFFDTKIPTVSGASVKITSANNETFNFTETSKPGNYICNNFVPVLKQAYTLTILLNGETYTAVETMKAVSPINRIEPKTVPGFTGDRLEIKSFYLDPKEEENFYMLKYYSVDSFFPTFDISDDRFTNGNENFGFFASEDLKKDDKVEIILFGISKRYYQYMRKLTEVSGAGGGGPFATPPATIRGNIINKTNSNNFALGYFNISETDHGKYIVE